MTDYCQLFQVVEVKLAAPHERRVMETGLTEANAEAFIKLAVMRRGVAHQFYVAEPVTEGASARE